MKSYRGPRGERGSTLLVALIFLFIFAIMTAAVFRGSLTSVQAIGNMQWRSEAINAANDAIDRILSSADFATKTAIVTDQINTAPIQIDINGDGVNDISVNLPEVTLDGVKRAGPRCLRAEPIANIQLDPDVPADIGCFGSSAGGSGLGIEDGAGGTGGAGPPPSLCSNSEWSITVRATDAVTGTTVDVVQGVGVRVPTTSVTTCN